MKIDKSQANKWRKIPVVSFYNMRKLYPNSSNECWSQWFYVARFWNGKIIKIMIRHWCLSFDFRRNWLADMSA